MYCSSEENKTNVANSGMKKQKRDSRKAFIVKELAEKHGVTTRYVYMVLDGERDSERILSDYLELYQGTNKLLEAVKKAVPF